MSILSSLVLLLLLFVFVLLGYGITRQTFSRNEKQSMVITVGALVASFLFYELIEGYYIFPGKENENNSLFRYPILSPSPFWLILHPIYYISSSGSIYYVGGSPEIHLCQHFAKYYISQIATVSPPKWEP